MEPNPKRIGDLAIEEDLSYQRKAWVVQRTAWWLFGLILGAALFGLFGRGGFSHQRKTSSDGSMTLEYERFLHRESPESLELSVRHSGQGDTLRIWITNSYLMSVQLQQVIPEPAAVRAEATRLVYQFSVPKTNVTVLVKFSFQPEKPGSLSGLMGTENGSSLPFTQFVYP